MKKQNHDKLKKDFRSFYKVLMIACASIGVFVVALMYLIKNPDVSIFKSSEPNSEIVAVPVEEEGLDKVENGIHVRTGFVEAPGMMETVQNCTNCHSAKLVIQNRMNKERWKSTIKWMQETQNLWDLGKNEDIIIDYLVTNYPPQKKGRREVLSNIDWYELKD
ncbi:monoheme cytochrome C [Zobellia barbeyronii]|uniref:Monoheme cytochrome C n=1 Tax=Zobellia barbeyronii TaxID=2748009 RepID=A0ABS5WB80_9FLAO|nr:monoheme cytochrome C [Zobellia barbeyronii]MBT2160656.1 monoheme cytochrome C [Zobellia barbeyronii]